MHFVGQSVRPPVRPSVYTIRVRAITYLCICGLPYNLVCMSLLRQCAVTLNRVHTSKVNITRDN